MVDPRLGFQNLKAPAKKAHRPPMIPPMVETMVVAPPMATLWSNAKKLPAATLPIIACHAAAIEPNNSEVLGATPLLARRRELTCDGSSSAEANRTQNTRNYGGYRDEAEGYASGTQGQNFQGCV